MKKLYVVYKGTYPTRAYISGGHVTLKLNNNDGCRVVEFDISNAPKKEYTEEEWRQRNG